MAAITKSAPLVAFLTAVAPSPDDSGSAPSEGPKVADPASQSPNVQGLDEDMDEGARAVILTILSNAAPISEDDLKTRSEFDEDLYSKTVQDLTHSSLIAKTHGAYVLTSTGIDAAAREKARILNIW